MDNPVTTDQILRYLQILTESKKMIPREEWLNCAFRLESLKMPEVKSLNQMRQNIAIKKLALLKAENKPSVAAVEVEIETLDEYREFLNQEEKIKVIDEFVRISKKNSDMNF